MPSVPYTPAQMQALALVVTQARHAYPDAADQVRITKALQIIQEGRITLGDDHYASVVSSDKKKLYRVNGSCQCPDYTLRGVKACKHRFAVSIYRKFHTIHFAVNTTTWQHGLAWYTTADRTEVAFLADDTATPTGYPVAEVTMLGAVALMQNDENLVALACGR